MAQVDEKYIRRPWAVAMSRWQTVRNRQLNRGAGSSANRSEGGRHGIRAQDP